MEDNKDTAEVVDRKEGYYWVRHNEKSDWEIAEYISCDLTRGWWLLFYDERDYYDKDFSEIDERQICRS